MRVQIREVRSDGGTMLDHGDQFTDQTHWKAEQESDTEPETVGFKVADGKWIAGWGCIVAPTGGRLEMEAIDE